MYTLKLEVYNSKLSNNEKTFKMEVSTARNITTVILILKWK